MKTYYYGLSVGGTKCAVSLWEKDADFTLLSKDVFATEKRGYQAVFEDFFRLIDEKGHTPSAIGITCGGPLDEETGEILSPPNLPGWDHVEATRIFKDRYACPVRLCNDANAGALAEWKYGAGKGCKNMVFITFGTGCGAGLIVDGRLYSGSNGMAGEIGHVRLEKDGGVGYGKIGSVEGFVSGGGMAQTAKRLYNKEMTAKEVAQAAECGEAWAEDVFRITGEKLGDALSVLTDILNPDRIVIGGIYPRNRARLDRYALPRYEAETLSRSRSVCEICPATLGENIDEYAALATAVLAEENEGEELYTRFPELFPLKPTIDRAIEAIVAAYRKGGKVLLAGNGGSSADCGHIVGELVKSFKISRPLTEEEKKKMEGAGTEGAALATSLQRGIPAIDLTAQAPIVSAFGNDVAAEKTYAQLVFVYGKPEDVVIGLSTSGNSKNVVYALAAAKGMEITSIAMTGEKSGRCGELADIVIAAPHKETYRVQEYHLPIYHHICARVEAELFS